jgi:23S rRNA (uracil1939-C5)-methyltransferase
MQVRIEKIVPEGKSLAHLEDGRVVFVWGGLAGELVEIDITKSKKSFAEGVITEVLEKSPDRIEPVEEHYLICSPWQILPYQKQIETKTNLLKEAFFEMSGETVNVAEFYESEIKYGYRTKMEYSFTADENNKIALAFHKRGANNEYQVIAGCKLGGDRTNAAAAKITEVLNTLPDINAKGFKSLTVRESKTDGKIVAILLHKFREYEINITLADLGGLVDGLVIGYSTIKSPVSVITELRYKEGIETLEETVAGLKIQYPFDGFFQNNIPVFEQALKEIDNATPKCNKLVELYSGVGTIGLALCNKAKEVNGLEIIESTVEQAKTNSILNGITNYAAITLPDHKITSNMLAGTDVLVLDPPRSGLHPKTTAKILEAMPSKIIYLSCNPVTQARDYALLKDTYKCTRLVGFDFYPNTVHMESLIILETR